MITLGARFTHLCVIGIYRTRRFDQFRVICRCDCGTQVDTTGNRLRSGSKKSCGCYRRARMGGMYRSHGKSQTAAYKMFYDARKRAVVLGLPFDLDPDAISIPETCPVLGIPLLLVGPRDNRPSLDRIRPRDGYVPGNIAVVSFRANRIKSDATPDELRLILKYASGQ